MESYMKKKVAVTFLGGLIFSFIGFVTFFSYIGRPLGFVPGWLNLIYSTLVVKICLIIGGLLLFISSFTLARTNRRFMPIITGIVMAALGALPLAMDYGIVTFVMFSIPETVLSGLLAAYGLYLIYLSYRIYRASKAV